MAKILLLGGTAWLGRTLAEQAVTQGHAVTCLARGVSGGFPAGVRSVAADRTLPDAYRGLAGHRWDLVVELTRFPAAARSAVEQLSAGARNWVFVSSCSVYADQSVPAAAEDTALLPPLESSQEYAPERYGEAKSGCEWLTVASRGVNVLLVRPGLIGGPGDPTGRSTYWPLRAADPRVPLLIPQDPGTPYPQHVQIIDVRDLAAFILSAGLAGRTGAVNAVGASTPLAAVLADALQAAHRAGEPVPYPLERMTDDGVAPWSGPRSLPLVLPREAQYAGFARRSDARALALGLDRRPLIDTFRDILAQERPLADQQAGGGFPAGLTGPEEAVLARRPARSGSC